MRGTKSTGYEGYRAQGVRILVRGTKIFSGTGYEGYGVREVPIVRSTDFGTGYDDFFQARGTKGTKYEEHRTPRVRKLCKNTKYHNLDIFIPVYRLHRHCAKTGYVGGRHCEIMSERVKVDSCAKVNDHAEVDSLSKSRRPLAKLDGLLSQACGPGSVRTIKDDLLN